MLGPVPVGMERRGGSLGVGHRERCQDDVLSQEGAYSLWAREGGDYRAVATTVTAGACPGISRYYWNFLWDLDDR